MNLKWVAVGFFGAFLVIFVVLAIILLSSADLRDYINVELLGGTKDCGSDWACFQKFASNCGRASLTTSQGLNGINTTVLLETQGMENNKCNVDVGMAAPQLGGTQSLHMACSVTLANLTQIKRENCAGPLADLLVSMKIW